MFFQIQFHIHQTQHLPEYNSHELDCHDHVHFHDHLLPHDARLHLHDALPHDAHLRDLHLHQLEQYSYLHH